MRIRYWLAAAAVSIIVPSTASAEEAVESAIRGWIAAIDATPEWSAGYGQIFYDAVSDTARVSGFFVRPESVAPDQPQGSFSLETLSVTGYVEGPDGYTVRAIAADGGLIEAGFMTIRLADIAFDDLSAPYGLAFAYDAKKPFSSIMQTYADVLGVGLRQGTIGSVTLDQTHDGVTSTVVYRDFRIEGMADGRIARFDTGAVLMDSPTPDGLVRMKMSGIESRDTDLGAFVHVYDPSAYVNGVGDMQWRDALGYAAYHDVVMEVPGATVNIGSIVFEDLKLRQTPESFVSFLDDMIANPNMPDALAERMAMQVVPAMFSAFSLGRFALRDMSVDAMGIDHVAIQDIHFDDLSIDGLGEFGIEGIEAVVQGQGAIEVGRFAFGNISFGGYDALKQIIAASMTTPPPDMTALAPKLGFVELLGLELQTPEIPRLSLERFRTDFSDYVGLIPTRASAALAGLSIPVSAITDPSSRDMLRKLGYDRIVSRFGFDGDYDPQSQRLTIGDLHYGIADMGSFAMSAVLGDLPVEALQDEVLLQAVAPSLRLEQARFTFKDDSIVGKGLDLLAGYMNAPPGLFRDQFADAMPFLLSIAVQNDPQLMAIVNQSGLFKQLTPIVRDFVANPGSSITVALDPPTPVRLEAIGTAVENTPKEVVGLLGLTISGEKGTLPPPSVAPETPPPTTDPGGMTPSVEPPSSGGTGGQGMTPATPAPGGGGSTPASRTGSE